MNIFLNFLNIKLKTLLKNQKSEKALSVLKKYNRLRIQKYYTTHIEEWVEKKEYDLIGVFLKTGYELEPSIYELLKNACTTRNEALASFAVKGGAFKFSHKKDAVFDLLTSLIMLENIPKNESDNLIGAMFSGQDKTPEELGFVIKSWNTLLDTHPESDTFKKDYIDPLNDRIQVFILKDQLQGVIPVSVQPNHRVKRV